MANCMKHQATQTRLDSWEKWQQNQRSEVVRMAEWNGWAGSILDVNLSTGKITKEPISKEMVVKYVGGRGLAARILYDEVGPETDPLGPDNIILVTSGALEGTRVPTSGRYDLTSKSPQTGIYGASNGGGFFGQELKRAGYDVIVIRGKSEKPVYLSINDDEVEIRDASHLWGQDTQVTEEMIRDELGDPKIRTLKIGPAGENECFSSCVIGDLSRAAGSRAIGAVWGSKKLKAVAVRGSKRTNVARPEELDELCRKLRARAKEDPLYATWRKHGTAGVVVDVMKTLYEEDLRDSGESVRELLPHVTKEILDTDYFDKSLACANCDLHCGHQYSVKEGKYKGTEGEGPEAGAIAIWRTMDNPAFILAYNTLCNKLGLNISPAGAIERAIVLYGEGIITQDDTGGIELRPGNEEAALELTRMIAYKEGFGRILDEYLGGRVEELSKSEVHDPEVKGPRPLPTDFRTTSAYTLARSVATRGNDHLTGGPWDLRPGLLPEMSDDVLEKEGRKRYGDPQFFFGDVWAASPKGARLVFDLEVICALADMTGTCKFRTDWVLLVAGLHLQDYVDLLSAATGVDFTSEDLVKATERQNLLQRAFNAREGRRRKDDYPDPLRWQLEHNMEQHPSYTGRKLPMDIDGYGKLLDEYYKLRGCDLETGIPTREKLEELGLGDVADDLERRQLTRP